MHPVLFSWGSDQKPTVAWAFMSLKVNVKGVEGGPLALMPS